MQLKQVVIILSICLICTICDKCDENCIQCSINNDNECKVCRQGYVLNGMQVCIKCPINCKQCKVAANYQTYCQVESQLNLKYTQRQLINANIQPIRLGNSGQPYSMGFTNNLPGICAVAVIITAAIIAIIYLMGRHVYLWGCQSLLQYLWNRIKKYVKLCFCCVDCSCIQYNQNIELQNGPKKLQTAQQIKQTSQR